MASRPRHVHRSPSTFGNARDTVFCQNRHHKGHFEEYAGRSVCATNRSMTRAGPWRSPRVPLASLTILSSLQSRNVPRPSPSVLSYFPYSDRRHREARSRTRGTRDESFGPSATTENPSWVVSIYDVRGRPLVPPSRPFQDICNTGPDRILWRMWLCPRALTLCYTAQLKARSERNHVQVWKALMFDMVHGAGLNDQE